MSFYVIVAAGLREGSIPDQRPVEYSDELGEGVCLVGPRAVCRDVHRTQGEQKCYQV